MIVNKLKTYIRNWSNIRKLLKKAKNIKIGENSHFLSVDTIFLYNNVVIGRNNTIHSDDKSSIIIKENSATNNNVFLSSRGGGKIVIGQNVIIAPNVVIRSNNHIYISIDIPIKEQGVFKGNITIEDDVWIAANCVILPNVKIGKGSIIGAGSVVTKDVHPYSIMGGVPAKKIGSRITDEKTN